METKFLDVESCLTAEGIPFLAISFDESGLEKKITKELKSSCGIIITGSRKLHEDLPGIPDTILSSGLPILGLCYGYEWLGYMLGAKLIECNPPLGEHSEVEAKLHPSILFDGLDTKDLVFVTMAHNYMLEDLPQGSRLIASTKKTPIAGFESTERSIFGLQFHPERDGSVV